MIPLTHYLILSGVLFAIGLMGVIVRRDIIVIFMCLEMMLSAANLSLVAFSRAQGTMGLPNYDGQALSIFILTIAAAEVAIGLALIVSLYRARRRASASPSVVPSRSCFMQTVSSQVSRTCQDALQVFS